MDMFNLRSGRIWNEYFWIFRLWSTERCWKGERQVGSAPLNSSMYPIFWNWPAGASAIQTPFNWTYNNLCFCLCPRDLDVNTRLQLHISQHELDQNVLFLFRVLCFPQSVFLCSHLLILATRPWSALSWRKNIAERRLTQTHLFLVTNFPNQCKIKCSMHKKKWKKKFLKLRPSSFFSKAAYEKENHWDLASCSFKSHVSFVNWAFIHTICLNRWKDNNSKNNPGNLCLLSLTSMTGKEPEFILQKIHGTFNTKSATSYYSSFQRVVITAAAHRN